jgi:hypothetical protein
MTECGRTGGARIVAHGHMLLREHSTLPKIPDCIPRVLRQLLPPHCSIELAVDDDGVCRTDDLELQRLTITHGESTSQ